MEKKWRINGAGHNHGGEEWCVLNLWGKGKYVDDSERRVVSF